MKHYLLIGIFAAVVFIGSTQVVYACSCVPPMPGETLKSQVKKSKTNATAIFIGTVMSVRYSDETMNGTPVKRYAKLKVERSWKGPTTEFIEIESANVCCLCGIEFNEGQRWIVYSNSNDPNSLSASSCSRTYQVKGKSLDERYLGKARKIKKSSK